MSLDERYSLEIEEFGKRLQKIRKRRKMTQLDLEMASGIARTEISRIENGEKNIEFYTVVKLAIALEIELFRFFKD